MRVLLLVLAAVLGGCGYLLDPGEPFDRQLLVNELRRRESFWKSNQIHDYDFSYLYTCQCSTVNRRARIQVRADVITRVLDLAGNDIAPQAGVSWPTVDSLFLWANGYAANRDVTVDVMFESFLDFPTFIQADVPIAAGDRITHTASALVAVSVPSPIVASAPSRVAAAGPPE